MNSHLKRVLILLLIFTFVFQMAGVTSLSRVQAYADTETEEVLDVPDADEAEDVTTEEIDTESPGEIETDGENPPDAAEEPTDPETASEETAEVPEETPVEEETVTVEEPAEEPVEVEAEAAEAEAPMLKAATKAEKTGTVLAFTSDTHNKSGNAAANRLGTWIEKVKSIHGDIDVMAFGGDMAGAGASGYFDLTQADFDMLTEKGVPGVYTTGNHEISYGGDFSYSTYMLGGYSSTETKGQFEIDKIGAEGDDYIIYCLGSHSSSSSYADQISSLTTFLNNAGNNRPIFIITHFPLHVYSSRTTSSAAEMIDAINEAVQNNGQTIIFLWGHNHTMSDTYYDQIYGPGTSLPTDSGNKTIQFYYGGAGCMSDKENGTGSEYVKGKGLAVTITPNSENSTIAFHYYDANGQDVTESNSVKSVDVEITEPVPATGVTINEVTTGNDGQPVGKSIAAEKTLQLHLTLEPQGASSSGITWTSSDESVATVSNSGLVTAKKEGTAIITAAVPSGAKAAGATSSIEITVTAAPKEVSITPASGSSAPEQSATIDVGETLTINVTNGSSSSTYNFTASLSDSSIAKIEGNATVSIAARATGQFEVKGLAEGTVDITIQNSSSYGSQYVRKGTIHLTVEDGGDPVSVTGVTVEPETATIKVGKTATLTATVAPNNATNKNVAWSSSDETVATVSNGTVTGVAAGTATITATTEDGSFADTCAITVIESHIDKYVLVNELEANSEYIIMSANSETGYALKNNGASSEGTDMGASSALTITKGDIDNNGSEDTYIENDSDDIVWTTGNEVSIHTDSYGDFGVGFDLSNTSPGGYLEGKSGGVKIYSELQYTTTTDRRGWKYNEDQQLQHVGGRNTYTVYYSNRFTTTYDTNTNKVYLFKKYVPGTDPVSGVTVSPTTLGLGKGSSATLTATVQPSSAANKNVSWSTSDANIATVDNTGKVTGVAEGEATITVTTEDGGYTASCEVTVTKQKTYVITVGGYALSTERSPNTAYGNGNSTSYNYTGLAGVEFASGDGAADNIRWIFEETTGGYYIKSLDGKYLNATYTSVTNPTEANPTKGDVKLDNTLDVWVLDSDYSLDSGTVDGSKLKSTNASAGSTSDKFLGYENDKNLFTIRSSSNADSVTISEASDPVTATDITVNPNEATILVGGETQLAATVTPDDATGTVTWTSSNDSIATVNNTGKVTGVAVGTATITATIDGLTATCNVTVNPVPVESVTLNKASAEVMEGKTLQLTATVLPETATDKTVTWTSSDPTVATVDETGKVTGVKTGSTATITATAGGKSASCEVTVTEYVAPTGYVIMVDGYALSHESADPDYFQYTGTSNNYFGLKAVEYDSENDPDEDILWIITPTEDETGYYITDQQGNYLNATYSKDSSNNTIAHLLLNDTPDKWSLDNGINLENWIINVSKLSSANATEQGGKGYYLARETGRNGTNLISIRSESSADDTSLIDPAHPVEIFYVLSNTLAAGEKYLIVNTNEVGSGFALGHSGSTVVTDGVTINTGKTETDSKVYIDGEDVDGTSVWTAASGITLSNNNSYMRRRSNGSLTVDTTTSNRNWTWSESNNRLSNGNYYLGYSDNTFSLSSSTNSVYLYKEIKIISDSSTHEHTYGTPTYAWAADNTTCTATAVCSGCEEGTEGHTVTETVNATSEITTPATCEGTGVRTFTATFANALFSAQTETEIIAATGHAYGTPEYAWASDNSKVTATRVCANDASHVETETVNATGVETTPATCTASGVKTWTSVAFTNTAFAVQTKTETIPALNHDWNEPTYVWAADHTSVTATRTCKNDPAHTETETVAATSAVTTAATCTTDGVKTWTSAAFTNTAFAVQTTTETITATGHDWNAPTYVWATDNSTVTATSVCAKDDTHVDTETVNATGVETTPATCTEPGVKTWTSAAFTNTAFAVQTKTEAIPKLNHDWEFVDFSWTGNDIDGYTEAVANYKCKRDEAHTQTVNATVTPDTTAATCTTAGSTVYTATVAEGASLDGAVHNDTKTVAIEALGHKWSTTPTWTWTGNDTDGYTAAKATFICENDATHKVEEEDTEIDVVTVDPTPTTAGSITYTASVTGPDNQTYTDRKVKTLTPTGYTFKEPVYTWTEAAGGGYSCTALKECNEDQTQNITETVTAASEVTTPATCETAGVRTYTATFTKTDFETQTKTEVIPPLDHDWSEPAYTWAADYKSVTATRTCKNDSTHVETETVTATGEITTAATCTADGVKTWTSAAFTNTAFTVQTTTETIPAINHDWNAPTYEWAADHTSVTATRTCKNNVSHTETETVAATSAVTTPATCTEPGVKTWTSAAFENAAFTVQTTTEAIPAINHDWNEPEYVWAADNSSVTATRTCKNDPNHVETETAAATDAVTTPATCTQEGVKTWTSAEFTNPAFAVQRTTEIIPKTGHDWDAPTYVWAEDYTSVTATRICKNDPTHVETDTVAATGEVTKPATCTEAGVRTWTSAAFSNTAFEAQTTTETIPAIGHIWIEPAEWTWIGDDENGYTKVEGTFTCQNDSTHTQTVESTNITTNRVDPTPTQPGKITYSAKITGPDNVVYSIKREIIIPAAGYTFKDPVYTWTETTDGYSVAALKECNEDHAQDITETVTASYAVTTAATCLADGVGTYTASFTNSAFATQTKTEDIPATGHTPVTDAAVAPTCTETGLTEGSHCSVCNKVLVAQETVPALGHDWNDPTDEWNNDHTSVDMTFTCKNDPTHIHTETVNGSAITSEITTQPTATAPGVRTYTATVTLDGKTYTVTDTEAIPATGTVSGNITSYVGRTEEGQVTVQLFAGDSTEPAYTATVTNNETYSFAGVAAGTYTMKVSKKDHVTRSYEITTDGTALTQDVKIHLLGDVNGDGKVNTRDVGMVNQHVREVSFIDGYEFACADVVNDGKLNTRDVGKINSHVRETKFLW